MAAVPVQPPVPPRTGVGAAASGIAKEIESSPCSPAAGVASLKRLLRSAMADDAVTDS